MTPINRWLNRQTVHRKLLWLILVSCCASLLVAGGALYVFMNSTLRANFVHDTRALSEIAAANCTGPLAFNDPELANELTLALTAQPNIVSVHIRRDNGQTFTMRGVTNESAGLTAADAGTWIGENLYYEECPIALDSERLGTIGLLTDFTEIHDRLLHSYLVVFVVVSASAFLFGIPLTAAARRVISDPIQRLAGSLADVSEPLQQERAKARVGQTSELEEIADAFTVMRERVEAGQCLKEEMAERRRAEEALRKSEEQFRSLFENAPVGLYRSSADGRFTMANPSLLRMLGYSSFEEIKDLDIQKDLCVSPVYRSHFSDCLRRIGMVDETEVQWRRRDGRVIYVRESAKAIRNAEGEMLYCEGCVEDITARKEAQAELQRLHRELVDASRAAGMAEVATSVLHNVGNVLNSVNVAATVVHEQIVRSKLASLKQAVDLLQSHLGQLETFLRDDPRGKLLPDFLIKVTQHLGAEHARWSDELRDMKKNIEHMKVIVSMQQSHAKITGAIEALSATELVEDAVQMNTAGLKNHQIRVERDFAEVPPVMADKHKVLQILVNLIRNAKQAMDVNETSNRTLLLRVYKNGSGRVKIQVGDNGMGITPENLTRIFAHGFTTRPNGHGFGLHSGALAAREMGGVLEVESAGVGKGATFTLELPLAGGRN
jgi:PAS domain S-box-containing protein